MRVLLVDEQILFREGLQSLLESQGIEAAGTARDGALDTARQLEPDVVLISMVESGSDALPVIRRLKDEMPAVRTVVLAERSDYFLPALRSGACGYLLTSTAGLELVRKLGDLERGEVAFSPGLTARLLEAFAGQEPGGPGRRNGETGQAYARPEGNSDPGGPGDDLPRSGGNPRFKGAER